MADFQIESSLLEGNLTIPPSKSHTLRAIVFASFAEGISKIQNYLPSPDTTAMINAVQLLGAQVTQTTNSLHIRGFAGKPKVPDDIIQCGNSGQVLRFIGAIASLIPQYTVLTGDASIRHNRPVKHLLDTLNQLGATALSSRNNGYAPIFIKGPITKKIAHINGEDSQPISGLLIAGAFAPHPIELHVINAGEKPWVELTLHWFRKLCIPYQAKNYSFYRMEGNAKIDAFDYTVPGDFSSAAFPIAAALLTGSELTLHNLDMEDPQGDKALIFALEQMGAKFLIDKPNRTLTVKKGPRLKGIRLDINDLIDALPILAVIGCFAQGKTEIVNAAIARKKESNRIEAIATELKKMGAQIEETDDGLLVYESQLVNAEVQSHRDHRIALSLSVAALATKFSSTIHDIGCIEKTYPNFVKDFQAIGAKIQA